MERFQLLSRETVPDNGSAPEYITSAAKRLFSLVQKNRFPRVQIFPLDHNQWSGNQNVPCRYLSISSRLKRNCSLYLLLRMQSFIFALSLHDSHPPKAIIRKNTSVICNCVLSTFIVDKTSLLRAHGFENNCCHCHGLLKHFPMIAMGNTGQEHLFIENRSFTC